MPFPLVPSSAELWRVDEATGAVTVSAQPHTDIFIDPANGSVEADENTALNAESMLNAATLLGDLPEGDFQLSARVTAGFVSTFDAGVLLLWLDERRWGKLCFEFSPAGEPMVVSVVCRGVSDDANAFVVTGRSVWLRVSRVDRVYAYHASLDGETWQLIRVFVLDAETSRDTDRLRGPVADRRGVRRDLRRDPIPAATPDRSPRRLLTLARRLSVGDAFKPDLPHVSTASSTHLGSRPSRCSAARFVVRSRATTARRSPMCTLSVARKDDRVERPRRQPAAGRRSGDAERGHRMGPVGDTDCGRPYVIPPSGPLSCC